MPDFSIFISRNQEDVQDLRNWSDSQNFELISKSLIQFESVSFEIPENWDVIFFPSPRAVDFFFRQPTNLNFSNKKFASAGKGTALALQKWVEKVDFVPKNSGKINEVQHEFAEWLQGRKVLFVGSNQSKKSVLTNLPSSQYVFVQVYYTKFKLEEIAPCQLYIFSSPSNVKSYLTRNQLPTSSKVISWGQSTTDELIKNGITPILELKSSELSELIQFLSASFND
ncbi:MAG: uroporphyrinogen-III synthase [Bacteroidota bacterium]